MTTAQPTPQTLAVDPEALRASVRDKYRVVATDPSGRFHFHTGRPLAQLLGYDQDLVDALPDRAVESFAGVANPFSLHRWARMTGSSTWDRATVSTASSLPIRSAQAVRSLGWT